MIGFYLFFQASLVRYIFLECSGYADVILAGICTGLSGIQILSQIPNNFNYDEVPVVYQILCIISWISSIIIFILFFTYNLDPEYEIGLGFKNYLLLDVPIALIFASRCINQTIYLKKNGFEDWRTLTTIVTIIGGSLWVWSILVQPSNDIYTNISQNPAKLCIGGISALFSVLFLIIKAKQANRIITYPYDVYEMLSINNS